MTPAGTFRRVLGASDILQLAESTRDVATATRAHTVAHAAKLDELAESVERIHESLAAYETSLAELRKAAGHVVAAHDRWDGPAWPSIETLDSALAAIERRLRALPARPFVARAVTALARVAGFEPKRPLHVDLRLAADDESSWAQHLILRATDHLDPHRADRAAVATALTSDETGQGPALPRTLLEAGRRIQRHLTLQDLDVMPEPLRFALRAAIAYAEDNSRAVAPASTSETGGAS